MKRREPRPAAGRLRSYALTEAEIEIIEQIAKETGRARGRVVGDAISRLASNTPSDFDRFSRDVEAKLSELLGDTKYIGELTDALARGFFLLLETYLANLPPVPAQMAEHMQQKAPQAIREWYAELRQRCQDSAHPLSPLDPINELDMETP